MLVIDRLTACTFYSIVPSFFPKILNIFVCIQITKCLVINMRIRFCFHSISFKFLTILTKARAHERVGIYVHAFFMITKVK